MSDTGRGTGVDFGCWIHPIPSEHARNRLNWHFLLSNGYKTVLSAAIFSPQICLYCTYIRSNKYLFRRGDHCQGNVFVYVETYYESIWNIAEYTKTNNNSYTYDSLNYSILYKSGVKHRKLEGNLYWIDTKTLQWMPIFILGLLNLKLSPFESKMFHYIDRHPVHQLSEGEHDLVIMDCIIMKTMCLFSLLQKL